MRFLIAVLILCISSPAVAQFYPKMTRMPCADGVVLPDILKSEYGEAPTQQGLGGEGLVQLWVNEVADTWTLVLISPEGAVCALAAGEGWGEMEPQSY